MILMACLAGFPGSVCLDGIYFFQSTFRKGNRSTYKSFNYVVKYNGGIYFQKIVLKISL